MSTQIASIGELLAEWSKASEASETARSSGHSDLALRECQHLPKEYIGFTDRYDYCTLCDAKRVDGVWRELSRK